VPVLLLLLLLLLALVLVTMLKTVRILRHHPVALRAQY
jgi:hypothetical protein